MSNSLTRVENIRLSFCFLSFRISKIVLNIQTLGINHQVLIAIDDKINIERVGYEDVS